MGHSGGAVFVLGLVGLSYALAAPALLNTSGVIRAFQTANLEVRVDAQDERAPQANVVQYKRWVTFSANVAGSRQSVGEIYEFASLEDLDKSRNLYSSDATRNTTFHKNIALLISKRVPSNLAAKYKATLLKQ